MGKMIEWWKTGGKMMGKIMEDGGKTSQKNIDGVLEVKWKYVFLGDLMCSKIRCFEIMRHLVCLMLEVFQNSNISDPAGQNWLNKPIFEFHSHLQTHAENSGKLNRSLHLFWVVNRTTSNQESFMNRIPAIHFCLVKTFSNRDLLYRRPL